MYGAHEDGWAVLKFLFNLFLAAQTGLITFLNFSEPPLQNVTNITAFRISVRTKEENIRKTSHLGLGTEHGLKMPIPGVPFPPRPWAYANYFNEVSYKTQGKKLMKCIISNIP